MNYPKVSIITVAYNAASDLRNTLSCISSMDYPNIEVVVIDGGSKDETPQVIEYFSDLISYSVSEPDKGIYDAMNKGINASTGEYLWFVNAGDSVFDTQFLKNIFAEDQPLADIYYGDTLIKSVSGEILGLRKKKLPERLTYKSFLRGMVVCHQSILVRRDIAPAYSLSYRYAADVEWVLLVLRRAKSIVNTHCIVSVFEAGGTSSRNRKSSLRERFYIMKQYFGLIPTLFAHSLFVFDALKPEYRKYNK